MYGILKLIIIFVISISVLISCSTINTSNVEKTRTITPNENTIVIDVGRGKTGSNISFKVNLSEGFKTKANISGWDSLYNSIDSYKIALVSTAGTGSNVLTTKPNGNATDVFSITKAAMTGIKTSPTAQIFITNVMPGTYWIAVSAFDVQGRNITKVTTTTGTISGVNFAVSTAGGDPVNNGKITVSADYSLPSNAVTTPLTLIDSFGADIQATVTISDGTGGTPRLKSDIVLIRFYLVDSKTAGNLVDANIIKGIFDLSGGAVFTSLIAGTATTITFKSIPAGNYYVAVAAYYDSATVDSTTNITNLTANTFANITITAAPTPTGNMGTFSLSNIGGDGGADPGPGRVVVDSAYAVSSTSVVILPLKLLDSTPVIMSPLLKGFAILAGSTVTNTGLTTVDGNIGVSTGSAIVGFPPGTLVGTLHSNDAVAIQAKIDLTASITDASSRSILRNTVAGDIGTQTLLPGLYTSLSTLEITSGDLTLDAQGDSGAVWIFQIASDLTTATNNKIILINGAKVDNVFWQLGSSATLGVNSVFKGNILAGVSITLNTGSSLEGRALCTSGAVTIDASVVTKPIP